MLGVVDNPALYMVASRRSCSSTERGTCIPAGHSEDFAQVLETASIDVDILLVPDLNHSQIVGHGSSLSVVEAFLERILTGR